MGGGSVIDTAKLMNLYTCYPSASFLDFVNAPLGLGLPIDRPLKPLIAIPTTAGTGSETTGTAIFDLVATRSKTGVAHRALKPTLGICDPLNTATMPSAVHASSGLDVLCHSLDPVSVLVHFPHLHVITLVNSSLVVAPHVVELLHAVVQPGQPAQRHDDRVRVREHDFDRPI